MTAPGQSRLPSARVLKAEELGHEIGDLTGMETD